MGTLWIKFLSSCRGGTRVTKFQMAERNRNFMVLSRVFTTSSLYWTLNTAPGGIVPVRCCVGALSYTCHRQLQDNCPRHACMPSIQHNEKGSLKISSTSPCSA